MTRTRIRLDVVGELALFTVVGVAFGLAWWMAAGTADMPYWVALLLIAATEIVCRLVSAARAAWRRRTAKAAAPVPARHRRHAS